jgi:hypothetical protein
VSEDQIKGELRRLLLPIRPELETDAIDAARWALDMAGIDTNDHAAFLRLEQARWRESGTPDDDFATTVKAYLEAGETHFGGKLAKKYFVMHATLAARAQLNHDLASALLSHARLIAALAEEDRLSSAQIAQLLSQRAPRLPSSWLAVEVILRAIGSRPTLSKKATKELFDLDRENEEETFADADLRECVQLIGNVASELGLPPSFEAELAVLVTDPFVPYLKMLHFLCTIAEYYDHPPEFPYEFAPRGKVSAWLAGRYPKALGTSGNPFLNNAKSVDVLDRSWANSKKPAQSLQAHALVTVIESLSGLGFSARRELATWIRRLLARIIRLSTGTGTVLKGFKRREVEKLVAAVAAGETHTLGILEQRLVDALGSLQYGEPRWVPRGLGDSVYATNVSRRKCGDCDFQNASGRRVNAFEPHAGTLTEVYVRAHELTLERVLRERVKEWSESVGGGRKWSVTVTFVAHDVPSGGLLGEVVLPEVTAKIRAVTFAAFVAKLKFNRQTVKAFEEHVRGPLMETRTPEAVREKVKLLIA